MNHAILTAKQRRLLVPKDKDIYLILPRLAILMKVS